VRAFWDAIKAEGLHTAAKLLVLRHDVDTDCATARCMWRIERPLGIRSSYYFRLSTLDIPFMREIERDGGEASYHYEELATFAKRTRSTNPADVLANLALIRKSFQRNLTRLRKRSGLPITIVASHGDFANRKLSLCNWLILQDHAFRDEVNVELEV